ncbi:MAG: OmpA family protein, partial [Pseudomonadota bacterium]
LVEGVMPDEDTRAAVAADLRGRSGPALALTLALRVPRRVIAPFRFVAETRGSQAGLSVKSCALRSEEERVEILAVLAAAGARLPREGCAVGIGGPALPWAEAVLAGLAALTRLGEGPLLVGRLELSGASVLLSARVPAVAGPRSDGPGVPAREDEAAYEAALGALAATLPAGFLLDGRLIARAPADAAVGPAARFWLALGWEDGRLALSGRLPGPASRRAVMRLLSARLGQEAVSHDALRAEEATAPPGFEDAAVAAAEAMIGLSPTAEAEAVLTELGLTVQATVRSAEEAVRLQYALARSMPDGVALTTELTVDLPGALALRPLPPARCAHLGNGAVTERPLRFDPGSARIEAESIAVLDRLAEILVRCEGARIEIGGHTDNQGSEGFNQRLSKARAESVLAGLRERGLGRDAVRLTAAGYGEAQPVASNRTPDGRARNRRIAFRLLDG